MITTKNVQYCVNSTRKGEEILILNNQLDASLENFLLEDFHAQANTGDHAVVWYYAEKTLHGVPELVSDAASKLTYVQELVSNLLIDAWNCKIDHNTWLDIFDIQAICEKDFASQVIASLTLISKQQG